jgi:hypothetical protein
MHKYNGFRSAQRLMFRHLAAQIIVLRMMAALNRPEYNLRSDVVRRIHINCAEAMQIRHDVRQKDGPLLMCSPMIT